MKDGRTEMIRTLEDAEESYGIVRGIDRTSRKWDGGAKEDFRLADWAAPGPEGSGLSRDRSPSVRRRWRRKDPEDRTER